MDARLEDLQTLAGVIHRHYDLGEVHMPRMLTAAHQRRHRKLIIETSKGRFLVKTYKRDPYVLDALRFQHRLSDHLRASGLPVAHIKQARNGKRIVELEGWAIELQAFIEGTPLIKVTRESLATSGAALGTFHESCRDFPRPERDAQKWRFSEVPRAELAQLFARARTEGEDSVATEQCNAIALFLRDAALAMSWDVRSQFETGLIHGDWHGGNLIFRGSKLVAVVDLEFAGDGCFLEDLSYALSNLCLRTSVDPGRLKARFNLVLDHYQLRRSLSFAEEAALYYAVGIKHVATVAYQLRQQRGSVAGLSAFDWMGKLAAQCEWLTEQAHSVRWGE